MINNVACRSVYHAYVLTVKVTYPMSVAYIYIYKTSSSS
jgi:hypothetical protein